MKLKIVFTSDFHIGLKTDEIDRVDEIIEIVSDTVRHCEDLMSQGFKVVLVLGGDIFNTNTPSEYYISRFIGVLNLIRQYNIQTYVMVGNHDSVPDPNRLSCLSFIRKIKSAYQTITLVDDIKFLKVMDQDSGPLYFTFLPHVTKALVHKKIKEGKYKGDKTTHAYIDSKCNRILKKIGESGTHYVFSHLNVIGAHPGSEENLLKKSEVFLPRCFTDPPMGYRKPTIIQGHIHKSSLQKNIHIIGSPIFCTFGETGDKYFAEISAYGEISKKDEIHLIETNCRRFCQIELDMIGETKDFFELSEVKGFLDNINTDTNPVIKFDITINPENNTYDWVAIREKLLSDNFYVKPILPRVVIKRQVRCIEQKVDLPVKDKVKVFLKTNHRKDHPRAQRIYKRLQKYLGE